MPQDAVVRDGLVVDGVAGLPVVAGEGNGPRCHGKRAWEEGAERREPGLNDPQAHGGPKGRENFGFFGFRSTPLRRAWVRLLRGGSG